MNAARHAVITGGSSGLGLQLALDLASEGYALALVARDRGKLHAAVAQVRAKHPAADVQAFVADVADEAALSAVFAQIAARGPIDLLINNAGALHEGRFEQTTDADFRRLMDVNYFGALNATRAALPHLRAPGGRILNVASMAALTGVFGYTAYCGSKHALLGTSDALRVELAPRGIHVQVACPGEFVSPMTVAIESSRTPENRMHAQAIPKQSVELISRELVRGLRGTQFLIIPGLPTRLAAMAMRHLPGISRFVADRRVRSAYTGH